jgi:hypothetical protein
MSLHVLHVPHVPHVAWHGSRVSNKPRRLSRIRWTLRTAYEVERMMRATVVGS